MRIFRSFPLVDIAPELREAFPTADDGGGFVGVTTERK